MSYLSILSPSRTVAFYQVSSSVMKMSRKDFAMYTVSTFTMFVVMVDARVGMGMPKCPMLVEMSVKFRD